MPDNKTVGNLGRLVSQAKGYRTLDKIPSFSKATNPGKRLRFKQGKSTYQFYLILRTDVNAQRAKTLTRPQSCCACVRKLNLGNIKNICYCMPINIGIRKKRGRIFRTFLTAIFIKTL